MSLEKTFYVQLGKTSSPQDVVDLLERKEFFDISTLKQEDTCFSFVNGEILGEGKLGTVFDIDDNKNNIDLVLKEFNVNDSIKYKNDTYILSSALNEIVISSYISKLYSDNKIFCGLFPYFEGFFMCDDLGYIAMEKLGLTISKLLKSNLITYELFRNLIFQVLYSLIFLSKHQIMHNDAHTKNIMLKETKSSYYKEILLSDVKVFCFQLDNKQYRIPNLGYLAILTDYDFTCKFSNPKICPSKIYKSFTSENWNLKFRFAQSYDILTFVAYIVFYVYIKDLSTDKNNLNRIRAITKDIVEHILHKIKQQIKIIPREHYKHELEKFPAIYEFFSLVSEEEFRPYEEYVHINLSGILDCNSFKTFFYNKKGGFLMGRI